MTFHPQSVELPDRTSNTRTLALVAVCVALIIYALTVLISAPTTGVANVVSANTSTLAGGCSLAWRVVPSANADSNATLLYGVDAVSPTDVWAVGAYYLDDWLVPFIEHWDGVGWSRVQDIGLHDELGALYGVTAISSNDVWAVGYYRGGGGSNTLTLHWNGSA